MRGAFRSLRGQVTVAQASTQDFHIYSPEGRRLGQSGGRGSGPGEFLELTRVRRIFGDSLFVFDLSNSRLSILDITGKVLRLQPGPKASKTNAIPEDAFGDGSLLVTPFGAPPTGIGLTRSRRSLWRVRQDGVASPMVEFPEQETFFFRQTPRPIAFRRPFFGKTAYYAAGRDRLFWGTTDHFALHVLDLDGKQVAIYRRPDSRHHFGASDVARLIDRTVNDFANTDARPALHRILEELPTSGTVPEWGVPDFAEPRGRALLVDDIGNIWMTEYHMPDDDRNTRAVLDPEGRWLGSVTLPPGFSPYHIGADFVLGVWRDIDGVEHVRLYTLVKP